MPADIPALIVGAGPTGLMLAGELGRHGVASRMIDKRPGPADHSRAIGVQARTLEIFDHVGIVEDLLPRGTCINGMSMFSGGGRRVHFRFRGLDSPYPFALAVPQTETESVLTAHAVRHGAVPEWSTELLDFDQDADGVTATVRRPAGATEEVRARYLLGCDGAHSPVRKGAGLSFEGESYETGFALADVRVDWKLPADEVLAFLHPAGLFAVFPLPGAGHCRLTWSTARQAKVGADAVVHGQDAEWPAPTLDDVRAVLAERTGVPATVRDPVWLAHFRVNSRMATDYRRGRVFLTGDAAHIHSPAGGQGMNTGLQDAFNLAWKLALVEKGRGRPELLDTYAAERHAVGVALLQNTDRLTGMVMLRNPVVAAIRNAALSLLTRLPAVQRRALRTVSELAISYPNSPLTAGNSAGERAALTTADGKPARLVGLLRDASHFTLLLPADDRSAALAERVRVAWGDAVRAHAVAPRNGEMELIRPDGYVGFRGKAGDEAGLTGYLERWLKG